MRCSINSFVKSPPHLQVSRGNNMGIDDELKHVGGTLDKMTCQIPTLPNYTSGGD